jgi:uncharacterized protein HemY
MKEMMKHGIYVRSQQLERKINRLKALIRKGKYENRKMMLSKLREINTKRKAISELMPGFFSSNSKDWQAIQPEIDKVLQRCSLDLKGLEKQCK